MAVKYLHRRTLVMLIPGNAYRRMQITGARQVPGCPVLGTGSTPMVITCVFAASVDNDARSAIESLPAARANGIIYFLTE